MAKRRKLSKRKISLWILLFAAIILYECGAWHGVVNVFKSCTIEVADSDSITRPRHPKTAAETRLDTALISSLKRCYEKQIYSQEWKDSTGIFVYDVTAEKVLFEHNADLQLRPASNMKMITCLAALHYLGPGYKNVSSVSYTGKIKGDSLMGNLIYKFGYDLWFNDSCLRVMNNAVQRLGIHGIKGRVVLDLAIVQPIQHEEHWTPGDLKGRKLNMVFRGEKTMKKQITYSLAQHGIHLKPSQMEVRSGSDGSRSGSKLICKVETPIEQELAKALMNSSNENAEALAFLMGDKLLPGNVQHTSEMQRSAALTVLRQFITDELRQNPDQVATIHDGCGLCIHNRITPRFLVQLYLYAYDRVAIYDDLVKLLPINGESGTMHRRLAKTPGLIQAKTGTLTREGGITSLSGITHGKDHHLIFFSIIQNNIPVADARLFQDKFCKAMVGKQKN